MKQVLVCLVVLSSISGCAAPYIAPSDSAPISAREINRPAADLFRAAKQVLASEGYQITNSDDAAGLISTAQKDVRLDAQAANCGKTLELDYLKDKRTSSRLGFDVMISENRVTITANISASYLPGDASKNLTLTCISRGVIEQQLLAKIALAASS